MDPDGEARTSVSRHVLDALAELLAPMPGHPSCEDLSELCRGLRSLSGARRVALVFRDAAGRFRLCGDSHGREAPFATVDFVEESDEESRLPLPGLDGYLRVVSGDQKAGVETLESLASLIASFLRRAESDAGAGPAETAESRIELARRFCHDFNNVLATVLPNAELILQATNDARTARRADAILQGVSRGAARLHRSHGAVRLAPTSGASSDLPTRRGSVSAS